MYLRTINVHNYRNFVEGTSLKCMYMYHLLYNIHTGIVILSTGIVMLSTGIVMLST